jgi:small subunit ribosomal protein S7e
VSARARILNQEPQPLELQVAQYIQDLSQNQDLKQDLQGLQFHSAKEVEIQNGRKAILVFVPVPLLKLFHKVQVKLVRELEKKFSDRHVLLVAQRRILQKPTHKSRLQQKRPRSRTLTSVHEKLLEDLVYPTEIVGKRTKVKVDGSRLIKVFLDRKDHTALEYKLDTFSAAYKKLTGKDVVFEFPIEN